MQWHISLLFVGIVAWGCADRGPVNLEDAGRDGALPRRDGLVSVDLGRPPDAALAGDVEGCSCPEGQVWRLGECVPTVELGCGPSCDPDEPSPCPSDRRCDSWAAAPCCLCASRFPACVPEVDLQRPLTGPLRVQPTLGGAGQPVTLRVEGAPFYVFGALFYRMRLGNEEQLAASSSTCALEASFTPPAPGLYPVEVSQYGGQPPWALAGFYTASGGVIPLPSIQPGFPCASVPAPGDAACLSAGPYSCTCLQGRCACE